MVRILIVDDNLQFRRTIRLALGAGCYEVQDASDGQEALEAVAIIPPDLVVLDRHMPGMSVNELVTHIESAFICTESGR